MIKQKSLENIDHNGEGRMPELQTAKVDFFPTQMRQPSHSPTPNVDKYLKKIGSTISYPDAAKIFNISVSKLKAIIGCSEHDRMLILRQLHKSALLSKEAQNKTKENVNSAIG